MDTATVTPESSLPTVATDDLWTADSERLPPEPVADPAPVESAPIQEPDAADPEPQADAAERDDKGQFKAKGKPRSDPRARVEQATAREAAAKEEARQAREESAALKARLEALERPSAPQATAAPTQAPNKPTWKTFEEQIGAAFESWGDAQDAYQEARDAWRETTAREQRQMLEFSARLDAGKAADPLLVQALAADPPVSQVMRHAIISSPQSNDIIRYLGTHPELCAQLAAESQATALDAVPVMRRYLEHEAAGAVARPDSASPVRPSTAKPPINRVGGTASATPVDPEDLEFSPEYIRQENAREKKRQEAGRW